MAERDFDVRIVNSEGQVVMNETVRTLKNGFLELWLPRDRRLQLKINGMNREINSVLETTINSDTCITNLQLK